MSGRGQREWCTQMHSTYIALLSMKSYSTHTHTLAVHVRIYAHTYVHMHRHTYVCTQHTHTCMYACTHTHVRMYVPVLKMIRSCLWATTSCTTGTDLSTRREKWPSVDRENKASRLCISNNAMHGIHTHRQTDRQTDRQRDTHTSIKQECPIRWCRHHHHVVV